jgi:hypothetical protein
MLNSDVYWITCEMVVTCDLLCWITTILACMLVGLKSLVISLDYRSYMGSSARIGSLRWLFLYLCSYNLDGSVTVPINNETLVVTSSISRCGGPTQFFGGVHRGRVCVRAFVKVSVRSCLWAFASVIGSRKKIYECTCQCTMYRYLQA